MMIIKDETCILNYQKTGTLQLLLNTLFKYTTL